MSTQLDAAETQRVSDTVSALENPKVSHSLQEVQTTVAQLRKDYPDEAEYRKVMDAIYNRVNADSSKNHTLSGLLPEITLSDSAVDPVGAKNDQPIFNAEQRQALKDSSTFDPEGRVTSTRSSDGKFGISLDSRTGTTVDYTTDQNGTVTVTTSGPNEKPHTTSYTKDQVTGVPTFGKNGDLIMNIKEQKDGAGHDITGTVFVHANGESDSVYNLGWHGQKTNDLNKDGFVDIKRDQQGNVIGIDSNVPEWAKYKDGKTPLPGTSEKDPAKNLTVDAYGNLSYDVGERHVSVLQNGTAVFRGQDGQPNMYQKPDGTTYQYYTGKDGHPEGWYDETTQPGTNKPRDVKVDIPKLDANGNLETKDTGDKPTKNPLEVPPGGHKETKDGTTIIYDANGNHIAVERGGAVLTKTDKGIWIETKDGKSTPIDGNTIQINEVTGEVSYKAKYDLTPDEKQYLSTLSVGGSWFGSISINPGAPVDSTYHLGEKGGDATDSRFNANPIADVASNVAIVVAPVPGIVAKVIEDVFF